MCLRIYLQPFFTTRWKADGNNSFSSYSIHISSSLKHVAAGTSVLHRHVFFILLLSLCSAIPQDFLFKEVFKYSIFFPQNTFIIHFLLWFSLCWSSPITATASTSYKDCGPIPGQPAAFNLFLNHPFHTRKRRVTARFQNHSQKSIDVASEPDKNQKFS